MSQITFALKANGALVNATSVVLSDPTGAFGLRRTDTDQVLVANATAMTNTGTGTYSIIVSDPPTAVTYEYWVKWVYAGQTYTEQRFLNVPASPTGGATNQPSKTYHVVAQQVSA